MSASLFPCTDSLLAWLPDESLFSLCSRLHRMWGYGLSGRTTEILFESRHIGTQHDLPSGLGKFALRTEGQLGSAVEIARNKTLLRFFRPFLAATEVDQAIDAMSGPSVAHLKFRLGLLTSRLRANHPLKACEACMHADVERHGWAYWHLPHQYPGVWICLVHGRPLMASSLKSTGVERFLWRLPELSNLMQEDGSELNCSVESRLRFSALTTALVEHPGGDGWLGADAVQQTLRRRLAERGLIHGSGNLKLSSAAADYLNHCRSLSGIPDLSTLPVNVEDATMQVGQLLRPLRAGKHPLRLLAAIDWLFDGVEDFAALHSNPTAVSAAAMEEPERENTKPTLRVDQTVREGLIELIRSGRSPTAASRVFGVDVSTAMACAAAAGIEVSRRPKVLSADLRAALVRDLREGCDKAEASTTHGISIVSVTRTLRTEVGLHDAWKAARLARARHDARSSWLRLLDDHSAAGVKLLRALAPAAYAWLYRNDRNWLAEHTPAHRTTVPASRRSSVQWDERDSALCHLVQEAVLNLAGARAGKSIRLWRIYQLVPELKAKLSSLDRLPLTRRAIESALERRSGAEPVGLL